MSVKQRKRGNEDDRFERKRRAAGRRMSAPPNVDHTDTDDAGDDAASEPSDADFDATGQQADDGPS